MFRLYNCFIILLLSAVGLQAQCWPTGMTHDTRQEHQWLSCIATQSPNPQRGQSFWVMYDLGTFYELTTTKIWNFNEPGFVEQGITKLGIDYSLDGTSWKSLPDANLELASGERSYEGQPGPDLEGIVARYVLLTALETGTTNSSCAGLAEVRFDIGDPVDLSSELPEASIEVFPNPTKGQLVVILPNEAIETLQVYDAKGRIVLQQKPNAKRIELDLSVLPRGVYMINAITLSGERFQQRVGKIE